LRHPDWPRRPRVRGSQGFDRPLRFRSSRRPPARPAGSRGDNL